MVREAFQQRAEVGSSRGGRRAVVNRDDEQVAVAQVGGVVGIVMAAAPSLAAAHLSGPVEAALELGDARSVTVESDPLAAGARTPLPLASLRNQTDDGDFCVP